MLREGAQHGRHTEQQNTARVQMKGGARTKEMRQRHREEEQLQVCELMALTEWQVNTKRIFSAPQGLQPSQVTSNPTSLLC